MPVPTRSVARTHRFAGSRWLDPWVTSRQVSRRQTLSRPTKTAVIHGKTAHLLRPWDCHHGEALHPQAHEVIRMSVATIDYAIDETAGEDHVRDTVDATAW